MTNFEKNLECKFSVLMSEIADHSFDYFEQIQSLNIEIGVGSSESVLVVGHQKYFKLKYNLSIFTIRDCMNIFCLKEEAL